MPYTLNLPHYLARGELDTIVDIIKAIPREENTLELKCTSKTTLALSDLMRITEVIPPHITTVDLSGHRYIADMVDYILGGWQNNPLNKVTYNIPGHVTSINLSECDLGRIEAGALRAAFQALPRNTRSLNLSNNKFQYKDIHELYLIFSSIPSTVVSIDLTGNFFYNRPQSELNILYDKLSPKLHLDFLLDNYLEKRSSVRDFFGQPSEFYLSNFFSFFRKTFSLTQKRDAIHALKAALNGEQVDNLSQHLPALENGALGQELQAFLKSTKAGRVVQEFDDRTIRGFITMLEGRTPAPAAPQLI